MRIVHVGWGHHPQWKGCGPVIYVHTLALEQQRQGHDVMVVCASDRNFEGAPAYATQAELVDGIPYVHVGNRPTLMHDLWNPLREASDPACAESVAAACAEFRPEVIHIHNLVGLSLDVVAAARLTGARVINSLHNYFPLCSRDDLFFADAEHCGGPLERSCSRCLGTMIGDGDYRTRYAAAIEALNACDLNLAVSERVGEIYRSHGVDPAKVVVNRIGSTTGERLWRRLGAGRVSRAAAGEEQAGSDRLELIFFGNAALPRKGAMVLLQALRRLRHPDRVRARIFGPVAGSQAEQIEAFLGTCPPEVRAAISFHSGFTQDDLDWILSSADVAILTPRWEDNGPQTVFEALAAGLPVIATRAGGIPDVVEDGINGMIVEEGDVDGLAAAIDELSGDRARVARLRAGLLPPLSMSDHARALDRYYGAPGATHEESVYRCVTTEDVVAALAATVSKTGSDTAVLVDAGADEPAARMLAAVKGKVRIERDRAARPAGPTAAEPVSWPAGDIPDLHTYLRFASYAQLIDPSLRTLEVGCNAGFVTALLAQRIEQLEGCDVDLDALGHADRRMGELGRHNIIRFGDVCELPYEDGRFEQVTVADVLEHVPDDRRAVQELARVLAPGGRLIVNGPLPGYDVLFPREWVEAIGHVRDGYSRTEVAALLADLFEVVDWSENSRAADVLGEHYLQPGARSIPIDLARALQLEDDPASEPYGFTLLAIRTSVPATAAVPA